MVERNASASPLFRYRSSFIKSVDRINAFMVPRRIRLYQSTVLRGSRFSIVDPASGNDILPDGSAVMGGSHVGYHFSGDVPFWLIAGNLRFGYPITAAWFPGRDCVVGLFEREGARIEIPVGLTTIARRMEDLWSNARPLPCSSPARALLIVGHPNFAHHFWNELSGLEDWAATASPSEIERLEIWPSDEPLGPINHLITVLSSARIERSITVPSIVTSGLATRVGSTLITPSIRDRVKMAATDAISAAPPALGSPVFWVTARLDGRTCDNQTEFLLATIKTLRTNFPKCTILIDGFSYPEDYSTNISYPLRTRFHEREQHVTKYITHVISRLNPASRFQTYNVSGQSILETIGLAQAADYYIAHAGTLQHKIAWIHNTPGYIHTCVNSARPNLQRWYANQVEGGVRPDIVPDRFVTNTAASAAHRAEPRNFNYALDVRRTVSDIIRCIDHTLEATSASRV